MLAFYDVDPKYIDYLKTIDPRIPNIQYDRNNKFVCGVVLEINGIDYYAPISHMIKRQQTNIIIYDNNTAIASIRFSFMFPALKDVLTKKDFRKIAQTDKPYADLLATELSYCSRNEAKLKSKALSVYRIGCNKEHVLNNVCCDFKALEAGFKLYK